MTAHEVIRAGGVGLSTPAATAAAAIVAALLALAGGGAVGDTFALDAVPLAIVAGRLVEEEAAALERHTYVVGADAAVITHQRVRPGAGAEQTDIIDGAGVAVVAVQIVDLIGAPRVRVAAVVGAQVVIVAVNVVAPGAGPQET